MAHTGGYRRIYPLQGMRNPMCTTGPAARGWVDNAARNCGRGHGSTCGSSGVPHRQRGPEMEGQPPVAGPDLVHSQGTATAVRRRARRRQPAARHAPRGFPAGTAAS